MTRTEIAIPHGPAAFVYRPEERSPRGAYLLAQGLHFDGPRDARLDRFARVLAHTGSLVMVPFLSDHLALRAGGRAPEEFARAFEALIAREELPAGTRPGVFSISFGSLPALRLAASGEHRDRVRALLVFGGYADWIAAVRFALTGGGFSSGPRDPLNQAAIFLNLLEWIPDAPRGADADLLREAWMRFARETWGRAEMKTGGRHRQVARSIAASLPPPIRALFLSGCGADPSGSDDAGPWGVALAESALALVPPEQRAALEPGPLEGIRCRVTLVHGADDEVIHASQAEALLGRMPAQAQVSLLLTGLYGHSARADAPAGATQLFARTAAQAREAWTLYRMLRALASAGSG